MLNKSQQKDNKLKKSREKIRKQYKRPEKYGSTCMYTISTNKNSSKINPTKIKTKKKPTKLNYNKQKCKSIEKKLQKAL